MSSEIQQKHYSDASAMEKAGVVAAWLKDHKAQNVVLLDLKGRAAFTDVMLVATASSARHAQSLADGVTLVCGEKSYEFFRMSGYVAGQWILVDCNDFVVNVFQSETRSLYDLESLWSVPASREELVAMSEKAVRED